jgi:hypothetical protein
MGLPTATCCWPLTVYRVALSSGAAVGEPARRRRRVACPTRARMQSIRCSRSGRRPGIKVAGSGSGSRADRRSSRAARLSGQDGQGGRYAAVANRDRVLFGGLTPSLCGKPSNKFSAAWSEPLVRSISTRPLHRVRWFQCTWTESRFRKTATTAGTSTHPGTWGISASLANTATASNTSATRPSKRTSPASHRRCARRATSVRDGRGVAGGGPKGGARAREGRGTLSGFPYYWVST